MDAPTLERISIGCSAAAVVVIAGSTIAALWLEFAKLGLTGIVIGALLFMAALGFGIQADETEKKEPRHHA